MLSDPRSRLSSALPSRRAASSPEEWAGVIYLGRRAMLVRRHRTLVTVLVVVISLATCALLGWDAGFRAVWARLKDQAWGFLPVMLAAHTVAYGGYLIAHHEVVNRSRLAPLGWRRGVQVGMIGFGAWLVSGGFNVDRHALETAGETRTQAVRSAVALGLLELLMLAPAAWICALVLLGVHRVAESVTIPWVVLVPIGFAVALTTALRRPHEDGSDVHTAVEVFDYVAGGVRVALSLLARPRQGPLITAGIALYWAADIVALWAALQSVEITLSFPRLILAYATGYILTRRTLPFAGAVVIEVLMIFSLDSLGVPLAAAVVAVAIYRVSDFLLSLGGALLASRATERSLTFLAVEAAVAGQRRVPAAAVEASVAEAGAKDLLLGDEELGT